MHCPEQILLCRLTHRILLVIGQDHHVFSLVAEVFDEVARHIPHIVDATPQLSSLTKVVYTDKKRFPPTGAVAVLKSISLGRPVSKMLRAGRGRRRRAVVTMIIRIRVYRWHR
jgi:hypothetical protein